MTNSNEMYEPPYGESSKKLLTIIIPTYNMDKYLRHCLDSLIVPNMDKVEVLVINDGSKDSSSAIAHEYQNKYPQTFRVIDKENGNYGSCINRGLKEAKGKYIKVLDADDSFESVNYNEFVFVLESVDYDFVLTDYERVNEKGELIYKTTYNFMPRTKLCLGDIISKYPLGFEMHGVTYKTQLLRKINYNQPEGISYTDQIWTQEPFAYITSAVYIPLLVYRYLIGRDGQTMDPKITFNNMHAHKACALSMLQRTLNYPSEKLKGKKFMYDRTIHTINAVYKAYLFENKELEIKELICFDKAIQQADDLTYKMLDQSILNILIRYHYIRIWRCYKQDRLPVYIDVLYNISKSRMINRILQFLQTVS